jgi:DNA (cytosine-5)-methyltransferase 3A
MNVLSLFDGMSCGQIALERAGIKIDNYFASEIDKDAIFIAKKNFPNIKHIGSVVDVNGFDLPKIDLLIGGSPCQNLSLAVINNIKHNKGLEGKKSSLFYEYLRLLTETKPKYFFLENVGGMRAKDKDLITEALGVQPLQIDSNLLSAQDRDRYYWTNIAAEPDGLFGNLTCKIPQPKNKGIVLKDICLNADEVDSKFWYDKDFTYNGDDKKVQATLHLKGHDILKRVNNLNGKSATLTCCRGGNLQKKVFQNGKCRKLTPLEYERLQTVPDNYTLGVSDSQRYNMLGNGWTVDVIAYIFSFIKT